MVDTETVSTSRMDPESRAKPATGAQQQQKCPPHGVSVTNKFRRWLAEKGQVEPHKHNVHSCMGHSLSRLGFSLYVPECKQG